MLKRFLNYTCTISRNVATLSGGEFDNTKTVIYDSIPCMYDNKSVSTTTNESAVFYDESKLIVVIEPDKVVQRLDIVTISSRDYIVDDVRIIKSLSGNDNVTLSCKQV